MLVVTENARQVIQSIVADSEMPDGSGIRIDAPEQPPATDDRSAPPLQLQVASQPAERDQVVDPPVGHGHVAQQLIGVNQHEPGPIDREQLVGGLHDPA